MSQSPPLRTLRARKRADHLVDLRDEIASALTHGLGAVAALAGGAVLITLAAIYGDGWQLGASIVFGITLLLLYTASTLYHAIQHPVAKGRLKVFDHCAIYLLIAGTYTPFTLIGLRGPWGWGLFAAIWTLAIAGVVFKLFYTGRFKVLSTAIYIANWWQLSGPASYWEAFGTPSALNHTWSLAIEEQFYVLWPAVALVVWKVARRPARALLAIAGVAIVASVAAQWLLFRPGTDGARPYLGTDTRAASILIGLVFGVTVVIGLSQVTFGAALGLDDANEEGNIPSIAKVLFTKYVFAFEITSALLITAALGAMVLAHRERLTPKPSQAALAAQRMKDYAESGKHLGPLPPPGVFARHNAVDTPALLPDGTAAEASISRVLAARGTVKSAPEIAKDVEALTEGDDS